jgi:drug/metabolite transporter (DMT)-like permease
MFMPSSRSHPKESRVESGLSPLFAAALSVRLLGEAPHPYHGVAFALVVAGILVSSRR